MEAVLEAAHIHPYLGPSTNLVTNGLLVRADIHTLFDLGLIAVDDDFRLLVSPELGHSPYSDLHRKPIWLPKSPSDMPSTAALRWHRRQHGFERGILTILTTRVPNHTMRRAERRFGPGDDALPS
ncbi:HNH endonuclease [Azospirillum brasilense]|uniref:HNH endonuclease n=1 Tax=Azospirillum brasilense TaxID=192 RepID=UPI000E0CA141